VSRYACHSACRTVAAAVPALTCPRLLQAYLKKVDLFRSQGGESSGWNSSSTGATELLASYNATIDVNCKYTETKRFKKDMAKSYKKKDLPLLQPLRFPEAVQERSLTSRSRSAHGVKPRCEAHQTLARQKPAKKASPYIPPIRGARNLFAQPG
jgi:hypothetical protein